MATSDVLTAPALAGMRALRQWIVYMLVPRNGKAAKIPVHHATGLPCSVTDPANWTDLATAAASAAAAGQNYGVGFAFTAADPYWFCDLDSCLQPDGTWSPLAQQLVGHVLAGAAVEISASGKGLHLFGRGTVPPHASKNIALGAELYTADRFVALTGTGLQGNCDLDLTAGITWTAQTYFPPRAAAGAWGAADPRVTVAAGPAPEWRGPASDDELIRRALASRSMASVFGNRASFADLWLRDDDALARAYPPDANSTEPFDRSSADAALAQHLAFWCGKDQQRIIDLMRRSALNREKYERADYLPRTVATACGQQREVLQDRPVEPVGSPTVSPGSPAPAVSAAPAPLLTIVPSTTPAPPAIGDTLRLIEGSTFLSPAQQMEHFKGCTYVQDHHRVLVPGGTLLKPDQFKATYGGYSYVMDHRNERVTRNAFEAFTESQAIRTPRAHGICFKPRLPFGALIDLNGRTLVNTYVEPRVQRTPGDAGPFMRHLAALIPDEYERKVAFYFFCALVQRKGIKAQWALVLQGVEGNGKTFLFRCVARAIGLEHVYWPRPDKIGAQFNGWLVGHTMYVFEELMVNGRQELMDALKPLITSVDGIEIERKGVDPGSAQICGNFLAGTNHKNAILKTRNDRRWCMIQTAQQEESDLTRDGLTPEYMRDLHVWADGGGFAIVAELLHTTEIPAEFDFSRGMQRAPKTRSYESVLKDSRGLVEQEIADAIEREEIGFRGGWISSGFLDRLMVRLGKERYISINKRRELVQTLGYDWHPALREGRVNNDVMPDGGKIKLFVDRARMDLMSLATPRDVAAAYSAAQGAGGSVRPPLPTGGGVPVLAAVATSPLSGGGGAPAVPRLAVVAAR